jgi:hypothetical protein
MICHYMSSAIISLLIGLCFSHYSKTLRDVISTSKPCDRTTICILGLFSLLFSVFYRNSLSYFHSSSYPIPQWLIIPYQTLLTCLKCFFPPIKCHHFTLSTIYCHPAFTTMNSHYKQKEFTNYVWTSPNNVMTRTLIK